MQRASLLSRGAVIEVADLGLPAAASVAPASAAGDAEPGREEIEQALREYRDGTFTD